MADEKYIKLEDAILEIQRNGVGCYDQDDFSPEQAERFVISRLDAVPAANVRPVVRGRWEYPLGMAWNYVCSNCGYGGTDTVRKRNFCPHCGADMREVDDAADHG